MWQLYGNNYEDSLMMAHVVCRNMCENWQRVNNTFHARRDDCT
jgi:hypothetical protein